MDEVNDAGAAHKTGSMAGNNPTTTTSTTTTNITTAPSKPNTSNTGIVQPKPQTLPKRTGPSSIIVSPRQKGNPVLQNIKSVPWEYGDIPADYVLGLTTCALFLSLKYHRLHPEYIYTRIKALQGKYALRIVLVMVDISHHEESLRELSKTSLINNVTLILCWSSAEGARYLELFKSYENAAPTTIKSHQSAAYADRMIEFITTPRSVNKTDAVSLVSQFGSLRRAVNAGEEEVGGVGGWGEKKVRGWCRAVREPFRVVRAGRRGLVREDTGVRNVDGERGSASPAVDGDEVAVNLVGRSGSGRGLDSRPGTADADQRPGSRLMEHVAMNDDNYDDDDNAFVDDEEAMAEAMSGAAVPPKKVVEARQEVPQKRKKDDEDDPLSEGVMAALSKLRKEGG